MDFWLENITCYFWERKLISLFLAIIIAVGVYYAVFLVLMASVALSALAGIIVGIALGNLFYILTSESFCRATTPLEGLAKIFSDFFFCFRFKRRVYNDDG